MGFGIKKEAGSNSTPSEIVNFDKLTPTTAGVVFDPNTPATEDILYLSSVDASTWIWNGTAYVTYSNTTASTEWYLLGTTIDAGSNKTAPISRDNSIYTQNYDSYFNGVRIGRGAGSIATNTVVGNGAGSSISTGFSNTFNGYQSGQNVSTGTRNSFFGYFSGRSNTTAQGNTFIGDYSGYSNTTAQYNTFVGSDSGLSNTTAHYNTFIGSGCGFLNTTAQWNTFLGHFSGHFNTTGQKNTFLGSSSGQENTTGAENTFSGYYSGYFNTTGQYNTFSGASSGFSNTSGSANTFLGAYSGLDNTTGSDNIFIGSSSGENNTTASYNVLVGNSSGFNTTTGENNTFFGTSSGFNNITGGDNVLLGTNSGRYISDGTTALTDINTSVFLGKDTKALADNQSNQIVIGHSAIGKGSNTVNIGNTSIAATYLQGEVNVNPVSGQISRVIINSDNNVGALLSFRTANLPRWAIRKDGNETGSNVGGDLSVRRYDDAGAFIDNPISIKRSTGAVTFNNAFTFPTTDGTANYFLKTNGSGVVTWGVAGLSFFSEAQSTTAPNATVYANSLTAVASTTNADFAIRPKGTGAFTLAIPDSTSTGGNKRGANSVDLQSIRSSNSQVASGVSSFLAGNGSTASGSYSSAIGYLNTSSGTYSSAIGYGNIANNTFSFSFGNSCTASGGYSIAMGNRAKATNDGAICIGQYSVADSTASGQNSTLIGYGTIAGTFALGLGFGITATGAQATAIGYNANTFTTVGRVAIGGVAGGTGEAQKGIVSYRQRTTDATPTILTTNNQTTFGDNAGSQLALQNQQVMRFKGSITAKKSGTTDIAVWDIDGVIVRGANAASTVLTVSNVNVVTNIPAWVTPTLAANTSVNVGGLLITITGVIATNIQWFAVLDTVENIYA